MIDYTIWTSDFVEIAKKYVNDEQGAILKTIDEISSEVNYIFTTSSRSYSVNATYADVYNEFKEKSDEDCLAMIIADAILKDCQSEILEKGIDNVKWATHKMIEKIREKPLDFCAFTYAKFLLGKDDEPEKSAES
jgi:hypothetical protein